MGSAASKDQCMSGFHRSTVLVIEADPALRSLLADILAEEGYAVLQARGGADGLRIAREQRPEAILLDLGPAPDRGLELLERLRAGERTRYIPLVGITAGPTEAVAGREPRPDGVLSKPFDLDALLAHVARVARPRAALAGARTSAIAEASKAGGNP
jgi:DNA-binding response OmpR family regulator